EERRVLLKRGITRRRHVAQGAYVAGIAVARIGGIPIVPIIRAQRIGWRASLVLIAHPNPLPHTLATLPIISSRGLRAGGRSSRRGYWRGFRIRRRRRLLDGKVDVRRQSWIIRLIASIVVWAIPVDLRHAEARGGIN